MSDTLQPARQMDQVHPDADQLTAFAEHALPMHEREQTLAHLATCAGCRQVVFLAQLAVEQEAVATEPVRVRKPWLSGWNLVWTAALAVAGIAGFSVYMRNFAKPERNMDAVARVVIAPERPPVPAAPPLVAADGPVAPTPLVVPAAKKVNDAPPPAAVVGGVMGNGNGASLGAAKVQLSDQPTEMTAAPAAGSIHGALDGIANGAGAGVASAPKPVAAAAPPLVNRRSAFSGPMAQQVPQAQSQNQVATGQAVTNAEAPQRARVSALGAAPLAAPRPASPPPSPATAATTAAPNVGSANETVTVSAAGATDALATDGTVLEQAMINGRSVQALVALPSHLPASSTVSHGPVTLALDSAGSLFVSKDQERHWKRVKAQWDGHVARLSVVESSKQAAGAFAKIRAPGEVFRLTTDSGASWVSVDGQHWTRQ